MDSRYILRLYFGQDSTEIKLHTQDTAQYTPLLDVTPMKKARPGTASSLANTQFKPDSNSLTRQFASNPFAKMIMTPYVLDSVINKGVPNPNKTTSLMAKKQATIC
jgi:hypothetical protein